MKVKTFLSSTIILSVLGLSNLAVNAFAETNSVSENATANFELVAPKDTLKLTEASDLTFDQAVIASSNVVTTNSSDAVISLQELSGIAPGWQLSAKLGNFIGAIDGKMLTGAEVFYPSVVPTTTNSGNASLILPTSVATDTAFNGTGTGKIITAGSDAETIVTAEKGKGYGNWTMSYPQGTIQLNVPAGNLKDNYTATLTYTLVDSPS